MPRLRPILGLFTLVTACGELNVDLKLTFPEGPRPTQLRITSFTPIENNGLVYDCEDIGPYRAKSTQQDVDPAQFEALKARFPNAAQQVLSDPLTATLQIRRQAVGATMFYVEAIRDGTPYMRGCACVRDKHIDDAKLPSGVDGATLKAACPQLLKRNAPNKPLTLDLGPMLRGTPKLRWLRPPARFEKPTPAVALLSLELDGRIIYPDGVGVLMDWDPGSSRLLSSAQGLVFGDSPKDACDKTLRVTLSLPASETAPLAASVPCAPDPAPMATPDQFNGSQAGSVRVVTAHGAELTWVGLNDKPHPDWLKQVIFDNPKTATWAADKLLISGSRGWRWGTHNGSWSSPWLGAQHSCPHGTGVAVADADNLALFQQDGRVSVHEGKGALVGLASAGQTALLATATELWAYHAPAKAFTKLPSSTGNRGLAAAGSRVFLQGLSSRSPHRPGDRTPVTIWQLTIKENAQAATLGEADELIWAEPGRQFGAVTLAAWTDGELAALYEDLDQDPNDDAADRLRLVRWHLQDGVWRPQTVALPATLQRFTHHRLLTTDRWLFLASTTNNRTAALRWPR